MNKKTDKNHNFAQSFRYAVEGVITAFKQERNTRIHTAVAFLVVILGIIFKLDVIEWLWLLQAVVLVFAGELLNTAIEEIVDEVTKKEYFLWAKRAKDVAAGAVFLLSVYAVVVGLIVFLPKIIG